MEGDSTKKGRLRLRIFLVVVAFLLAGGPLPDRASVKGGEFTPLYGLTSSDQKLSVKPFQLDKFPVTNSQFESFLLSLGDKRKMLTSGLVSDGNFLKHWEKGENSALRPKKGDLRKPVVNVSWFAADEYCRSKGGRLPSVLEWEYAAAADEESRDASRDPKFVERLLAWYSKPSGGADALPEVGKGAANFWGIHDLHGLVWEWTSDFNSVFVAGDNRRDGEKLEDAFCGAGAETATDKANYAAFMRYAMRNSLRGSYSTSNLGFRCAYDFMGEY